MREAERAERPKLGEVVLGVEQEVVQHSGFGAGDEVAFAQGDERLKHVAPQDDDGLLAVGELHAARRSVQLARLTVVVLGDLVLDHDEQLAAVVDHRIEHLACGPTR